MRGMLSAWQAARDSGFLWHDSVSSQMSFHSSPSGAFVVSVSPWDPAEGDNA